MSLTRYHNDIVFQCDGPRCRVTLETYTSNFDSAVNALRRARWKSKRVGPWHASPQNSDWENYCPDHQGTLL